jgi:Fe-S oxidoreductase
MSIASNATNNIVEGIPIERSGENENADDLMRINREFDSNKIDESDDNCTRMINQ